MCHWVLRIFKCGDSFFTKYSSCSFDRAAQDPSSLLNPLHPSIGPCGVKAATCQTGVDAAQLKSGVKKQSGNKRGRDCKLGSGNSVPNDNSGCTSQHTSALPQHLTHELSTPLNTHAAILSNDAETIFPRDAKTGKTIPISLSEIGKASRFGDRALSRNGKCNVFEVVLQSQERTVCPACARSPKRARLPAHARGCFGLS